MLAVAGIALVAHLIWSAMVVGLLGHFYGHRIINIRKVKTVEKNWEEMSSAFFYEVVADAKKMNRQSVIFIGSSMTYGYPWQEPVIFTRIVAERLPDWRVANLSYIAADIRGLMDHVTCSMGGDTKPDVLVVEIPLVNSIGTLVPGGKKIRRTCSNAARERTGYWELVLTRPYGLGWLSLLWDEEAYIKKDADIQIVKLPSTYFASRDSFSAVKSQFADELREYVEAVSMMGHKVIVYVSPVYTPGIDESGADREAVEMQIEFAYNICRENDKVICIPPTLLGMKREMFYNLTHLNQRGHRALGEVFARQLAGH